MALLKKVLPQLGINPARLRLEWISSSEGQKFANTIKEFTAELRALGPLPAGAADEAVVGKEAVHGR